MNLERAGRLKAARTCDWFQASRRSPIVLAAIAGMLAAGCVTPSDGPGHSGPYISAQTCAQRDLAAPSSPDVAADPTGAEATARACLAIAQSASATNSDVAYSAFHAGEIYLALAKASDEPRQSEAFSSAVRAVDISRSRLPDTNITLSASTSEPDSENQARQQFRYDRIRVKAGALVGLAERNGPSATSVCGGVVRCAREAVDLLNSAETDGALPSPYSPDEADRLTRLDHMMLRVSANRLLYDRGEVGSAKALMQDLNAVATDASRLSGRQFESLANDARRQLVGINLSMAERELKRSRQTAGGLEGAVGYFKTVEELAQTDANLDKARLKAQLGQGTAYRRLASLRNSDAAAFANCQSSDAFARASDTARALSITADELAALSGREQVLSRLLAMNAGPCIGLPFEPSSQAGRQQALETVLLRQLELAGASPATSMHMRLRARLVELYNTQGRYAAAEKVLNTHIPAGAVGTDAATLLLLKAKMTWDRQGAVNEVPQLLEAASRAQPADPEPQFLLGRYWFENADLDKAWTHVQSAQAAARRTAPNAVSADLSADIYYYSSAIALERAASISTGASALRADALNWAQRATAFKNENAVREQHCRAAIAHTRSVLNRQARTACQDIAGSSGQLLRGMLALREAQRTASVAHRRDSYLVAADNFDESLHSLSMTGDGRLSPNWLSTHALPPMERLMTYGRAIARRCAGQTNIDEPADPGDELRRLYQIQRAFRCEP